MKVLNEEQQLKNRKEELWQLSQFLTSELSQMQNELRKSEDHWWHRNKNSVGFQKYLIGKYTSLRNMLSDYYSVISERLDQLTKESKNP